MQILGGNIISLTYKQEHFVAWAVLDYINEKYNKYTIRENAIETDILQEEGNFFPGYGTDQLSNLIV